MTCTASAKITEIEKRRFFKIITVDSLEVFQVETLLEVRTEYLLAFYCHSRYKWEKT